MKFFDKLFSKETAFEPEKKQTPSAEKKSTSPHELVVSMLKLAEITVLKGDYEAAFKLYQTIVEMEQNADAQYNLGNLYAMGKGTDRDFLQAAYWFYQAELNGEAEAKRLCKKSTVDYLQQDLENATPSELYQKMQRYATLLYPRKVSIGVILENLYGLGLSHVKNGEYAQAAKFVRAAAEFCNYGAAQNLLGMMYLEGKGVEKDELSALYWFDRAADSGTKENDIKIAKEKRDKVLDALIHSYSPEEFYDIMDQLIKACVHGSANIPQDNEKAKYWKDVCEKQLQKRAV